MTIDLRVLFNVPFTFQSEGNAAWWWIGANEAKVFENMMKGEIDLPIGDILAWISITFQGKSHYDLETHWVVPCLLNFQTRKQDRPKEFRFHVIRDRKRAYLPNLDSWIPS